MNNDTNDDEVQKRTTIIVFGIDVKKIDDETDTQTSISDFALLLFRVLYFINRYSTSWTEVSATEFTERTIMRTYAIVFSRDEMQRRKHTIRPSHKIRLLIVEVDHIQTKNTSLNARQQMYSLL